MGRLGKAGIVYERLRFLGMRRGDGVEKGAGSGFHGNDGGGDRNGSGERIWRMLGGIVVDHDSGNARRTKWGSWMAKSQL